MQVDIKPMSVNKAWQDSDSANDLHDVINTIEATIIDYNKFIGTVIDNIEKRKRIYKF